VKSFEPIKAGILAINDAQKQYKSASTNQQFITAKQNEEKAVRTVTTALTEQEKIAKLLETTKKRLAVAESAEAQALAKTRLELQNVNNAVKQQATQASRLTTEYQKQEARLSQLRKSYKDLAIRQEIHNNLTKKEVAEMKKLEQQANRIDFALKKVDKSVGQSQRFVGEYERGIGKLKNTFTSLVGAFGLTSGILVFANLVKGAVQNVKEFDSGLKNVQKTTGLSGDAIKVLGNDILNLSRKLQTVGTKSLLEYATVAGQLGVKGSANILAFTETLAQLETASDITGEEGGASIARLLTLVDGGVENVADFGDEIVKLGNNFAATEGEILANATAIAQNTGIYKLGRQSVLAYATATKAVGIESEITGSTIGKTLGLLEKALRTGNGVAEITRLTGKSVEELQQQFKTDSGSVFTDLLKGLNAVDKSGGSVNEQLELLGITAVREQRVIGSLATAGFGTLERAMKDVESASGSLGQEFETASSKLENQFNRLSIAWDNFILTIENGDGAFSKFLVNRVNDASQAIDSLSLILDGKGTTSMERANTVGNLLAKTLSFISLPGYLVRNTFDDVASSSENLNDKLEKGTKALQNQTEAFKEQYGSIAPLNEELTEQIKLREKLNILTGAGAFEDPSQDFGAQSEKVRDLRDAIKALNEEVEGMNTSDAEGIKLKLQEIAVLQKKLDALLGVTKGTKKAAKEQKDFNFETNKFINEQKIKFLEDFAKDETRDFDLRQTALKTQADLEIALSEYVLKEKLKNVKKGSDEERNIIVKAEAEKQAIIKRFENSTDDLAIAKIKANAETRAAIQEKLLNEELIRENENFEATKDQYQDLEDATEAHEKRVAAIKKKYAIQALQDQVKAIETLLSTEAFSADERIQLEAKIAAYKQSISDLNKEVYKKEGKERVMTEKEVAQEILRISVELANAIGEIIKNLSDARIENYEREIKANDEKFDKLLEDETLYEEDRKRLEDLKELKREQLERKIIQEKRRQARFEKVLAAVNIGINTAVNISEVAPNPILIALVAALGAAQLAAVAATPIPQYAKGTDNHAGGLALVGEERPEVISEPNKAPYVVSKPSVLDLPKGTKVTPSLEEYERLMRASIISSVHISNNKMNDFQAGQIFDLNNKELLNEMRLTRETIKKSKPNVIFQSKKAPNLPYEFFKYQQTNWRN
jgi:TP901 family phage tail tape measure protein